MGASSSTEQPLADSSFTEMKACLDRPPEYKPSLSLSNLFGSVGDSGFGSSSTADQVLAKYGDRLKGKTVIVTGPTVGGIGFDAAKSMAKVGAEVVLAGRSKSKGEEAVALIKKVYPSSTVTYLPLDLADLSSVREFASTFRSRWPNLHILLNNAGVMATNFKLVNGVEQQFAVCHLGHFLLTDLLLPHMEATVARSPEEWGRVINVSSDGHFLQKGVDPTTLYDASFFNDEANYKPWPSYGRAKLANVLHASWLAQRFKQRAETEPAAARMSALSLMPGVIQTGLADHLGLSTVALFLMRLVCKSLPQGAATSVYAAAAPELAEHSGAYLADCNLQPIMHRFTKDPKIMEQLVATSQKLVSESK